MKLRKNFFGNKPYFMNFTVACFADFLLLTPFVFSLATVFIIDQRLTNGIVSGKNFWFLLSMGLCSASSFFQVAILRKKLQVTLLDFLIFLFGLISILNNGFSHTSEITGKHILFLLVIIFYFYARITLQTPKQVLFWLTICFILSGLIEAIWGLMQLYGFSNSQNALFKLTGSFFNPGPYACYLAVVLPIALRYTLNKNSETLNSGAKNHIFLYCGAIKAISSVTVITILLVLPATMSRTAWMGAIGGCIFVIFHDSSFRFLILKKSALIAFRISCMFLFAFGFAVGIYYLKKDSADGRFFIWKNTIELIKQNPSGVGLGNFSGSYGHIQAAYFEAGVYTEDDERIAGNPEYAFNEYLQICAEHGVVAFIFFIGIIGYAITIGIKRKQIAATASLIALLIVAGASYPFSVLPFLIVFVFLLALINRNERGIKIHKPILVAFTISCMIIVSLCLYNRYPTYNAHKKWKLIRPMYNYSNYKEVAAEYSVLYPFLFDQIQFLFEYGRSLSQLEQYDESNEVLKKAILISCDPMLYNVLGKNYQEMKQYAEAVRFYVKASNIVPNRLYPHYLMMQLHIETGDMVKARASAEIVLTKEPKVQSIAAREMKDEAIQWLVKQ